MEIKMMNNLKPKLGKSIENRRDELTAMADKIFDLSRSERRRISIHRTSLQLS